MKEIKILNKPGTQSNISLTVNVDTKKLEAIEKALKQNIKAQVGILGDKNLRSDIQRNEDGTAKIVKKSIAPQTNAQIGFIHEFGSYKDKIPERSFLRVPLMLFLNEALKEASPKIRRAFQACNIIEAYGILGLSAEKVVQEAFDTSGHGSWPKLSPITIARKGSDAILIDSGQLRKSITSKVVS
jgi:phage gpG-like protein